MLWFWIYQFSEYTKALNMPGLHRVLNMPLIILEYARLYLNKSEYAWIPDMLEDFYQYNPESTMKS